MIFTVLMIAAPPDKLGVPVPPAPLPVGPPATQMPQWSRILEPGFESGAVGEDEARVAYLNTTFVSNFPSGPQRSTALTTGQPGQMGGDLIAHPRDHIAAWLYDENSLLELKWWRMRQREIKSDTWAGFPLNSFTNDARKNAFKGLLDSWRKASLQGSGSMAELTYRDGITGESKTVRYRNSLSAKERIRRENLLPGMLHLLKLEEAGLYARRRAMARDGWTMTMRQGLDFRFTKEKGGVPYGFQEAKKVLKDNTFVVMTSAGVKKRLKELRDDMNGMESEIVKIPELLVRNPNVEKLNDLIDKRVEERVAEEMAAVREELAALKRQVAAATPAEEESVDEEP